MDSGVVAYREEAKRRDEQEANTRGQEGTIKTSLFDSILKMFGLNNDDEQESANERNQDILKQKIKEQEESAKREERVVDWTATADNLGIPRYDTPTYPGYDNLTYDEWEERNRTYVYKGE